MMSLRKNCLLIVLVLLSMVFGCGGGGTSSGTQYTLDVEATMSVTPVAGAMITKDISTPQIMIGTTLVEVNRNTGEELGVNVMNFNLAPQDGTVQPQININLTPNSSSSGVIFKLCDLGNPLGTSYITLDLVVSALGVDFIETETTPIIEDGKLHLGSFQAQAEATDRTRLPLLGDIPVINFLFQGQQYQAKINSLLILLTPQIIADTE